MIVTTISKTNLNTITLPQKITGQYWLYIRSEKGIERLASVEGVNNQWILKSNKYVKIHDSRNQTLKNTILLPMNIYVLEKENGEKIFVLIGFGKFEIKAIKDCSTGIRKNLKTGRKEEVTLPKSNVLYYELADGEWCCARPSGTEPKIKFYMGVKAKTMDEANERLKSLKEEVLKRVE